jgi:hypothetical protein
METATVPVDQTASEYTPSHEDIACLAYALWQARGGQGGSAEEDWFQAEQQLRVNRAAKA